MSRLKARVERAECSRRSAGGAEVVEVPADHSAAESARQVSAALARRGTDDDSALIVVLRRFA